MQASTYPALPMAPVRSSSGSLVAGVVGGVSAAFLVAMWFANQGGLMRVGYPLLATVLAIILYYRLPMTFIKFTIWIWLLTPLVRRLVDWHFGFVDPNYTLLTPFLVSGVAALSLLRKNVRVEQRPPIIFWLCSVAIVYGFVIGMVLHPSGETVYGLVNWLCPLVFGLHLYFSWEEYPAVRRAIGQTFTWGIIVMGVYGLYQYFVAPQWDTYWLVNVQWPAIDPSFGTPEPLGIRVWSTLNAPGPFANVMMAGLLLLFTTPSKLRIPSAVLGFATFLLSAVRTAWISWIIGLLILLKSAKPKFIARVLLSLVLILLFCLPFVSDPRVANVISDRFSSFQNLGTDESFGARTAMYHKLIPDVLASPAGEGLKNAQISKGFIVDSGILIMFFSLGWFGTLLFGVGVASLFWRKLGKLEKIDDFLRVSRAIIIGLLAQLIGGNIFVSVSGAIFWIFAGMVLAGREYAISTKQLNDATARTALSVEPITI